MEKTKLHFVDGSSLIVYQEYELFLEAFLNDDGEFHIGAIHFAAEDTDVGHQLTVLTRSIMRIHEYR